MAAVATWRRPGQRRARPIAWWNPGVVMARIAGVTSGPRPPVPTSTRRSAPLGVLVGELHRHAAAEAVPDHGDPVDAQHGEQVAHAVGVAADAVVGARLVR